METVTGDVREVLKAGEEERNGESPDITPPLGCGVSTHWVEEIPDGCISGRDEVNSSKSPRCIRMSLLRFPRHVL